MWFLKFLRDAIAARAARVRALEVRIRLLEGDVAGLRDGLHMLAQNIVDMRTEWSDPAVQINAHLAVLAAQRGFRGVG